MTLYREEHLVTSTPSPDGALRLEEYCYEEERRPDDHRLKLVRGEGGGELWIPLGWAYRVGEVEFGPGDSLGLLLRFDGSDIPVRVDTQARTFYFHAHEKPEPLELLPKRVRERFSKPVPPQRPTLRRMLVILLELAGALLMLAATLFAMWLSAGSGKASWIFWLGLLLFGAATVFSLQELVEAVRGLLQPRKAGSPFFGR